MAKILIFPLLTMPSGHHKVADVIAADLIKYGHEIKKIDIISYACTHLEKSVTTVYQKILEVFPQGYEALYRRIAGPENSARLNIISPLSHVFSYSMKALIKQECPDFIVCTHGFPSAILSGLKNQGKCSVPVANVYTDFFINNYWGCDNIEYHFTASVEMANQIIKDKGKAGVFISGIPVDKCYRCPVDYVELQNLVLLTGGCSGLGNIEALIEKLSPSGEIKYFILCGNNTGLFREILKLNKDWLIPLPYVDDAKQMCELYDSADLIIGKPGGATITEVLYRQKTYLVHSCLPGQESYNLDFLVSRGLVINGVDMELSEETLISIINDYQRKEIITDNIKIYQKPLKHDIGATIHNIIRGREGSLLAGGNQS